MTCSNQEEHAPTPSKMPLDTKENASPLTNSSSSTWTDTSFICAVPIMPSPYSFANRRYVSLEDFVADEDDGDDGDDALPFLAIPAYDDDSNNKDTLQRNEVQLMPLCQPRCDFD